MKAMRNTPAPIALDFAQGRRPPSRVGWVLLAIGVAAMLWVVVTLDAARRELVAHDQTVQGLREQYRATGAGGARREVAPTTHALEPALKVAGELNASWGPLFKLLANTRVDGLALIEVGSDAGRGSLRLVGHARSLDVAFEYVGLLQQAAMLREVTIESHEWTTVGRNDVVRFTIAARWRGAG